MNISILYISPSGTTKISASLLSQAFSAYDHQVSCINIGKSPYREDQNLLLDQIRSADLVGFGSAAYHMEMMEPMTRFFSLLSQHRNRFNFRTFFFMNYSGITTGKAFLLYARQFTGMGIPICGAVKIIAPHLHHKTDFPSDSTQPLIHEFVDALEKKKYAGMSKQDIEVNFKPYTRKVHFIYPLIHRIGKKRELPISIDPKACILCGKCERECIVGAIEQNVSMQINFNKCLHCYHCVTTCPQKAIHCPLEKLDDMLQTNIKLIGLEQPGNLFYV